MSLAALLPVLLAVAALIGLALGAVILLQRVSGRCLQGGTCGSRGVRGPNGEDLACASCPNRKPDATTS
ncbi:MAG: hypothetical protein ACM3PU_17115 [Gemmatimonadota bacterium]